MSNKYINSVNLGKIPRKRVQWAVNNDLLIYDEEDYYLTQRSQQQYDNFFRWITGNTERLYTVKGQDVTDTSEKVTPDEVVSMFSSM